MMKDIQNLQFAYSNDEIDDRTLPPQNTRTKLVCLDVFCLRMTSHMQSRSARHGLHRDNRTT